MRLRAILTPLADISPIRALLDQGCDLEADVVPIVARELRAAAPTQKLWRAVAHPGDPHRSAGATEEIIAVAVKAAR
jgi:hypothetical protein